MPEASAGLAAFVSEAGWGTARREPLAGDASSRRYWRLTRDDGTRAVLMDSARDPASTGRFLRVGAHLAALGLSVPAILAADDGAGFLLLEDFGDAVFARVLEDGSWREDSLYSCAIDVLEVLSRAPARDDLPVYGSAELVGTAQAAVGWYPGVTDTAAEEILGELRTVLTPADAAPRRLCLRDYHAENLIWLPDRAGVRRAGLLDYQDAVAGHPAYDLVSLLQDARRDVAQETRAAMTTRYLVATGMSPDRFVADAAALSAQRNLRILTQFARLALRDGKPGYLRFMPRVWTHLVAALDHPELARLRVAICTAIRPPDDALIDGIRSACAR